MRRLAALLALLLAAPLVAQSPGAAYKLDQVAVRLDGGAGGSGFSTPSGCVATSVPIFLGSPVAMGCDAGLTYDAVTDSVTTGRILVGDGSNGAPTVTFISDPTVGVYKNDANTYPFTIGSIPAASFRSSVDTNSGLYVRVGVGFGASALAADTWFRSPAAATLQLGAAPSATPVANSLLVGESGAGTDIAGGGGVVASGAGTGSGAPSALTFKTPAVHGSDAVAQTQATRLSLKEGHINIPGLVSYANNAAALAGGLVAGDLYRTGADPDPVMIVH